MLLFYWPITGRTLFNETSYLGSAGRIRAIVSRHDTFPFCTSQGSLHSLPVCDPLNIVWPLVGQPINQQKTHTTIALRNPMKNCTKLLNTRLNKQFIIHLTKSTRWKHIFSPTAASFLVFFVQNTCPTFLPITKQINVQRTTTHRRKFLSALEQILLLQIVRVSKRQTSSVIWS